jgi:hypothetical protein
LNLYGTCPAGQVPYQEPACHLLAAIVAVPFPIPVANPVAEIDTIEESELLHVTEEVTSLPKLSTALNCTCVPTATV